MGRHEQAREEAAFLRGEVGIDGQATEEQQDEAEVELGKAREQYLRGKAYLGREFLTWLLWRSESGEAVLDRDGEPLTVLYASKVMLRGIAGEVTELTARGSMAPYSVLVRYALEKGLLLHSARILLTHGEKTFEFTLDAEFLDVKSAKLPELMSEQEDEVITERIWLAEQLSGHLQALLEEFLRLRASRDWSQNVVPQLKKWMSMENK